MSVQTVASKSVTKRAVTNGENGAIP